MEIPYRKVLTIDEFTDFGIEIETENLKFDEAEKKLRKQLDDSWQIKQDKSLKDFGLEIASPILYNNKETWMNLKKLAKTLKYLNPEYTNCSFQVNLSIENFNEEDIINFLKFYSAYEEIIIRISKGDDKTLRETFEEFARPISLKAFEYIKIFGNQKTIEAFESNKQESISLKLNKAKYKKALIEFRSPNSTDNIGLWQNYITLFYYMLKYVKDKNYDKEKIDYLFERCYIKRDIESILEYNKIKKAIELADMIFKEDIDKCLFLEQYEQKTYIK